MRLAAGDGRLDLVVGTMAGNMYVFGTTKHYHPSVSQLQLVENAWADSRSCDSRSDGLLKD